MRLSPSTCSTQLFLIEVATEIRRCVVPKTHSRHARLGSVRRTSGSPMAEAQLQDAGREAESTSPEVIEPFSRSNLDQTCFRCWEGGLCQGNSPSQKPLMHNDYLPCDSHSFPSSESSGQIANLASWGNWDRGFESLPLRQIQRFFGFISLPQLSLKMAIWIQSRSEFCCLVAFLPTCRPFQPRHFI
jgi:hypothetical protein